MSADRQTKTPSSSDEFLRKAKTSQPGVVREVFAFLRHSRKVWLAPIIIGLLLIGLIIVLGSTSVAPFIYTLF